MVSEGGDSFLSQKMTDIPQTSKTITLLSKRNAKKPTYREYHSMDCIPSSVWQEAEEGRPLHVREANSCDLPPLMSDEAHPEGKERLNLTLQMRERDQWRRERGPDLSLWEKTQKWMSFN
ncbi:hypothetical protein AGOR_G00032700 [Albula goreensis]|uniref:Uncharacterized protein n=1 Tax=Albula goreensis TaxID=1534307 RepID=A0A8T3DWG0_9TELE|nr:hypothetical protein AGOR_G00032700 [Albula goreensis]